MSDPSELNNAIKAHSAWKARLKDAVENGSSDFTPSQVRNNDICDFGKWLNSLPQAEKALVDYQNVHSLHQKFHTEAATVLQLAISGQKEKAHIALTDIGGDFVYTSAKLINAMNEWKKKLA